jgi:hypothetical protein
MEKAAKARRPYHKPQLEQVQLMAEEAVLKACKLRDAGDGPNVPCMVTGTEPCRAPSS